MSSARNKTGSSSRKKPSGSSSSGAGSSSRQRSPNLSGRDGASSSVSKPAPQLSLMEIVQKRFVDDVFESSASKLGDFLHCTVQY